MRKKMSEIWGLLSWHIKRNARARKGGVQNNLVLYVGGDFLKVQDIPFLIKGSFKR